MDENTPRNIFQEAAKAKQTSSSKKAEDKPSEEIPLIKPENELNLHRDPEINTMLNKMNQMHENIQSKLNDIYDKTGVSGKQIQNYLNNPSNFSPEIWQKIQGQRDFLEKKIGEVLHSYVKTKKGHLAGISITESKERKSKTLGTRKKWIPM